MTKTSYTQDRNAALKDIREAMTEKIKALALSPLGSNGGDWLLPDFMKVQETFKWPALIIAMAAELEQGHALKDVFGRVARPTAADLQPSQGSGRDSAFSDILKALDIAERDFDATYKPLDQEQMKFWQKKHPLEPHYLEYAYKENQRHYMKEAIADMRAIVENLRLPKQPGPGAKPGRKP